MNGEQKISYEAAMFSCPLCSSGLTSKQELLFCFLCNVFVGKPETFSKTMLSKSLHHQLSSRSTAEVRARLQPKAKSVFSGYASSLLVSFLVLMFLGVI